MPDRILKGTLTSVFSKRYSSPDRSWRGEFVGQTGVIQIVPSANHPGLQKLKFSIDDIGTTLNTSAGNATITEDHLTMDTHNSVYEFELIP